MSNDDARHLQLIESHVILLPHQLGQDTLGHIPQIHRSFAKVVILHGFEGAGVLFRNTPVSMLHIAAVISDHLMGFLEQGRILQHHQMRFKNIRMLTTDLFLQALMHGLQLLSRLNDGRFKAGELCLKLVFAHTVLWHVQVFFVQEVYTATTDTSGCGDALALELTFLTH